MYIYKDFVYVHKSRPGKRSNLSNRTGLDSAERVIGVAMDTDSTTRGIYVALSNGVIYKAEFTGNTLPTAPTWTKQSYTVPVGSAAQTNTHTDSLFYIKVGSSQRLYWFHPVANSYGYWKEISDSSWKRLKMLSPGNNTFGTLPAASVYPGGGNMVSMCGRAVWASGSALLVHDIEEDSLVLGTCFSDGAANLGNVSICHDVGGKFAVHTGSYGFWSVDKPYEETTHYQLPAMPGQQIYWKTA